MECQRTLDSLLLEPIQRVPRYELLLKDLLKHTPVVCVSQCNHTLHYIHTPLLFLQKEFPDYVALKDALNLIQKVRVGCSYVQVKLLSAINFHVPQVVMTSPISPPLP